MFANPYPLKEFTLEESLRLYKELMVARSKPDATTDAVIALLPPAQRRLAYSRHEGGVEREAVGRSVAHMKLGVVGEAFGEAVRALGGRRLGCFCDEASPCHAKVLAELAESWSTDGKDDGGGQSSASLLRSRERARESRGESESVVAGGKRKRDG